MKLPYIVIRINYLQNYGDKEILEQIDKTEEILCRNTNQRPILVRAPYGMVNSRVKKLLREHGYISVLWTVDSKDWSLQNTDKIYQHVLKKVKGNDIILMHDIFDTSVKAAAKIIDTLKEQGYTFVTVSEFIQIKNAVEQDQEK